MVRGKFILVNTVGFWVSRVFVSNLVTLLSRWALLSRPFVQSITPFFLLSTCDSPLVECPNELFAFPPGSCRYAFHFLEISPPIVLCHDFFIFGRTHPSKVTPRWTLGFLLKPCPRHISLSSEARQYEVLLCRFFRLRGSPLTAGCG